MFRVPNEHFSAIADIAGQPEAPNEPSDIVLAAFAQVQSLTETLNEYIKVSTHQEISAVSTSLCDECHKQQQQQQTRIIRKTNNNKNININISNNSSNSSSNNCNSSNSNNNSNINNSNQSNNSNTINNSTTPTSSPTSPTTIRNAVLERVDAVTDDDGYCEIDELRLPTVLAGVTSSISTTTSSLPTTITTTNTTTAAAAATTSTTTTTTSNINSTPELKRQSTISADSIPEETEHEINAELLSATIKTTPTSLSSSSSTLILNEDGVIMNDFNIDNNDNDYDVNDYDIDDDAIDNKFSDKNKNINDNNEYIEINNNNYESTTLTHTNQDISDDTITEQPSTNVSLMKIYTKGTTASNSCSNNRLLHATSIAPAVPCHLITSHITALSVQISQLLVSVLEKILINKF